MDVKIAFCTNYLLAFFSHTLTYNGIGEVEREHSVSGGGGGGGVVETAHEYQLTIVPELTVIVRKFCTLLIPRFKQNPFTSR